MASVILYAAFVTTQTVRHRDVFLPVGNGVVVNDVDGDDHATRRPPAPPPSGWRCRSSR